MHIAIIFDAIQSLFMFFTRQRRKMLNVGIRSKEFNVIFRIDAINFQFYCIACGNFDILLGKVIREPSIHEGYSVEAAVRFGILMKSDPFIQNLL